jgi:hypothetical protein
MHPPLPLARRLRLWPVALLLPAAAAAQPAASRCPVEPARRYAALASGDWELRRGGHAIGAVRVAVPSAGCLVQETEVLGADTTGVTVGFYDQTERRWVSSYVGADGTLLRLSGAWRDSATLVLTGPGYDPASVGRAVPHRLTTRRLAPDTLRQVVETSADGGRTWRVRWDVLWVRARPGS